MPSAHPQLASAMSDQVLPSEVSLQSDTWINRYRNYPVFSRTWFRYRAYAFLGVQAIVLVLITFVYMVTNPDLKRYWVFAVPIFSGISALCLLGQVMAVKVRQRAFSPRKEAICLISVLCLGAALSWGIFDGLRYCAKYLVYGDGNITLYFGDAKRDGEPRSMREKPVASNANPAPGSTTPLTSSTSSTSPNEMSNTNVGKYPPLVEMMLSVFQALPFTFVMIYTGSGFDLWVFFRQRKKLVESLRQQELARAQEARREAELRLSVLVAQVEPHFLFNTLAGVRSAILTEPARATAIVDHLVDYLRATIPQMRDDGASVQGRLAQQLEAARAYLALMQARLPRLSFTVESDVDDAALPPLMLISLVENAVKHGAEPKIGPVHIAVTAKRLQLNADAVLELTVADNGIGFGGTTSGSGIGLANIRERLESMFGQRASLQLKARPEGGIAAVIVLPLLN